MTDTIILKGEYKRYSRRPGRARRWRKRRARGGRTRGCGGRWEDPQPATSEPIQPSQAVTTSSRRTWTSIHRQVHPDTPLYSKAKPEVIEEARKLSCSVCRRHQQVRPARRSAPIRELQFNDCVGTDIVYLPLPNQKTRPTLNVIDWATKFQLMIPLKSKKPAMVREAYRHWLRLFGPPKKIATDMGREFKTDFLNQAAEDGSYVDPAAVEAPHQRGITERHGKTFKFMLMKAMDTYKLPNYRRVGGLG